ncbi:MAG: DUF418 domain-containing protein [Aestuariibacter sp.]
MTKTFTTDAKSERFVAMDVLRGFALLGILLLNIQSFAMPSAAYLNPTAFGDLSGVNALVWQVSHLLADQKFMSIFSMLFGAGIILFADNAERKHGSSAALHYRRTFWLLCFGLMHGYLFWYGDILYAYAMSGFLVYLLRRKSTTTLLIVAAVLLIIASGYSLLIGMSLPYFPPEAIAGMKDSWAPDTAELTKEISAFQGSFIAALEHRAGETFFMQTYVFLTVFIWRASAMMLIGMALYKSGFFQLSWSTSQYRNVALTCLPLGLIIVAVGMTQNTANGFTLEYSMFLGSQFNYWGSILVALSYASLIMIVVKKGLFTGAQKRLAAIGKTAFSNYIMHTLICTTVFYGYGLGLFSEIERWQQLLMVFAIWAIQLWLAPLWLKHYQFGPLEWAWRSLTYWQRQPIRNLENN